MDHFQIERGTLVIIDGRPYKVFLEPNNGLLEKELAALELAGIKNPDLDDRAGPVECQSIQVVSSRSLA